MVLLVSRAQISLLIQWIVRHSPSSSACHMERQVRQNEGAWEVLWVLKYCNSATIFIRSSSRAKWQTPVFTHDLAWLQPTAAWSAHERCRRFGKLAGPKWRQYLDFLNPCTYFDWPYLLLPLFGYLLHISSALSVAHLHPASINSSILVISEWLDQLD